LYNTLRLFYSLAVATLTIVLGVEEEENVLQR
jgi:hypothetical protein